MNIDRDLVNRALYKAGQEPLVDDDITKNNAKWRVIKGFYLYTILETLSTTSWTSQKKRAKLEYSERENLSGYLYAYKLPLDCAKPDELLDNGEYIVEGNQLYTDTADATLEYISNGYNRERYEEADPQPTSETFSEATYYYYDETDAKYKTATTYDENTTYYIFSTDDYPNYDELNLDPMLSQFIETKLASKIVLKITGKSDLYQLLYNEAMIMEQKAISTSLSHAHSKYQGNKYWAEQLGIGD